MGLPNDASNRLRRTTLALFSNAPQAIITDIIYQQEEIRLPGHEPWQGKSSTSKGIRFDRHLDLNNLTPCFFDILPRAL